MDSKKINRGKQIKENKTKKLLRLAFLSAFEFLSVIR